MLVAKLFLGVFFAFIALALFQPNFSRSPQAYLVPGMALATFSSNPNVPAPTVVKKTLAYAVRNEPTPTIIATVVPTRPAAPSLAPRSNIGSTQAPTVNPENSIEQFLLQAVNDFRRANGLAPAVANSATCSFATTRAQEISTNFSHDGFSTRLNSHTLPYPNYALVTENIAQTGDYKAVVTLWANSPEHAANMRADTPYICIERSGSNFAMEGWKPL